MPQNDSHVNIYEFNSSIAQNKYKMPAAEKLVINPDLKKERLKCSFDVEEFARYWIGSQAKLDEKRARGKIDFLIKINCTIEIQV